MNTTKEKSEFELIVDLLKSWLKRWYYFVAGVLICGIIGGVHYKLKTPEYEIRAMVALRSEDNSGGISGFSLMKSLGFGKSSAGNNVEDEAIIIASHGSAKKLVKELDLNKEYTLLKFGGFKKMSLYNRTPVTINYADGFTETGSFVEVELSAKGEAVTIVLKINDEKIGKYKFNNLPANISTQFGEFTFEKTAHYNDYGTSFEMEMLVLGDDLESEIYSGKINASEERKSSDIIHLKIVDDNIARGKDVLNTAIDIHNRAHAEEKTTLGQHTIDFVNERLAEAKAELDSADTQVQRFKEKYGITDPVADAKGYWDQASELFPYLVETQTQLESIKLIDNYLSDSGNTYSPIPFVVMANKGGDELMKAISAYNEELSKRNELFQSGKKQSPVAKGLDDQLKMSRENLLLALKDIRKSIEISDGNLKKQEAELRGKVKDYPEMEKGILELLRNQELKQAIYLFLQQKKEEAVSSSVALNPKLRIIDKPFPVSKPVSPNLMKIMLIVIFFGGVLIPLSAIALEPQIISFWRKRRKNK